MSTIFLFIHIKITGIVRYGQSERHSERNCWIERMKQRESVFCDSWRNKELGRISLVRYRYSFANDLLCVGTVRCTVACPHIETTAYYTYRAYRFLSRLDACRNQKEKKKRTPSKSSCIVSLLSPFAMVCRAKKKTNFHADIQLNKYELQNLNEGLFYLMLLNIISVTILCCYTFVNSRYLYLLICLFNIRGI